MNLHRRVGLEVVSQSVVSGRFSYHSGLVYMKQQ
jgi:hypothetical protein